MASKFSGMAATTVMSNSLSLSASVADPSNIDGLKSSAGSNSFNLGETFASDLGLSGDVNVMAMTSEENQYVSAGSTQSGIASFELSAGYSRRRRRRLAGNGIRGRRLLEQPDDGIYDRRRLGSNTIGVANTSLDFRITAKPAGSFPDPLLPYHFVGQCTERCSDCESLYNTDSSIALVDNQDYQDCLTRCHNVQSDDKYWYRDVNATGHTCNPIRDLRGNIIGHPTGCSPSRHQQNVSFTCPGGVEYFDGYLGSRNSNCRSSPPGGVVNIRCIS